MTHTIDTLMALHEDAAQAACQVATGVTLFSADSELIKDRIALTKEKKAKLHAALVEAIEERETKENKDEQQVRPEMDAVGRQQPSQGTTAGGAGLVERITALLALDEAKALVPYGVGGLAKELLQDAREALAPTIKQSLAVHASAEEYLQYRYGAYRGHFAWRELEEAYSQGRYDEAMLQGPNPWPDDEPEIQCGIFCEELQSLILAKLTQPIRVPLTIQEVDQILHQHDYELHGDRARYIVRMTEQAHGIGGDV